AFGVVAVGSAGPGFGGDGGLAGVSAVLDAKPMIAIPTTARITSTTNPPPSAIASQGAALFCGSGGILAPRSNAAPPVEVFAGSGGAGMSGEGVAPSGVRGTKGLGVPPGDRSVDEIEPEWPGDGAFHDSAGKNCAA